VDLVRSLGKGLADEEAADLPSVVHLEFDDRRVRAAGGQRVRLTDVELDNETSAKLGESKETGIEPVVVYELNGEGFVGQGHAPNKQGVPCLGLQQLENGWRRGALLVIIGQEFTGAVFSKAVFVAIGAIFGATDVSTVAFTREQGSPGAAGAVLATFALGSMISGLGYGQKPAPYPTK